MPLYRYQKHVTPGPDGRTVVVLLPPDPEGQGALGCELAELDGLTYVAIPDGVPLPEQPPEIALEPVTLTPELRKALAQASPHVQLINQRVRERIAQAYAASDELELLRRAVVRGRDAEVDAYDAHAEAARAWGRAEKLKLGL